MFMIMLDYVCMLGPFNWRPSPFTPMDNLILGHVSPPTAMESFLWGLEGVLD